MQARSGHVHNRPGQYGDREQFAPIEIHHFGRILSPDREMTKASRASPTTLPHVFIRSTACCLNSLLYRPPFCRSTLQLLSRTQLRSVSKCGAGHSCKVCTIKLSHSRGSLQFWSESSVQTTGNWHIFGLPTVHPIRFARDVSRATGLRMPLRTMCEENFFSPDL